MTQKEIRGGAEALGLLSNISNVDVAFVSAATPSANWPTGTHPFVIKMRDSTGTVEEKMLISSRAGTGFNVLSRGYDGTLAIGHTAGEAITHVADADTIQEANSHVNDTARDDHTQYLNATRHDSTSRHVFGGAFTSPPAPPAIAVAALSGSAAGPARSDHTHNLPDGIVVAGKLGTAAVVAGNIAVGGISAANQFASAVVNGAAIDSAIKDPAAATAGLRTLGTGAAQAAAGNDARLSDTRTPAAASITPAMFAATAPTAFTPTIGGTSWAVGNGVLACTYLQLGKLVIAHWSFTLGSTSAAGSGTLTFTLPVTATASPNYTGVGTLSLSGIYHLIVRTTSTTVLEFDIAGSVNVAALGLVSGTPALYAAGNVISADLVYFAA